MIVIHQSQLPFPLLQRVSIGIIEPNSMKLDSKATQFCSSQNSALKDMFFANEYKPYAMNAFQQLLTKTRPKQVKTTPCPRFGVCLSACLPDLRLIIIKEAYEKNQKKQTWEASTRTLRRTGIFRLRLPSKDRSQSLRIESESITALGIVG